MQTANIASDISRVLHHHSSQPFRAQVNLVCQALELSVSEADILHDTHFLTKLTEDYPPEKITTSEFFFIAAVLAIRYVSKTSEGDDLNSRLFVRHNMLGVKKKKGFTGAQIDFWKWWFRNLTT